MKEVGKMKRRKVKNGNQTKSDLKPAPYMTKRVCKISIL